MNSTQKNVKYKNYKKFSVTNFLGDLKPRND